jgi:hypothetical protein
VRSHTDLSAIAYRLECRKHLTPIRFVCACRRGHTDDVDWRSFVHRGKTECQRTLWIEERGTSGEVADT